MKAIIQGFFAVNRFLVIAEKFVLCALLFSMVVLSFGQVVARNLFSTGFVWVTDVIRIEVLWITVLGAALSSEYRQHIRIDLLYNIISSSFGRKIVELISQLFSMIVCFFLFLVGKEYISTMSSDSTSTMISGVPDWIFNVIIPYCFLMMSIRNIICVVKILQGIDTRKSEYTESYEDILVEK